MLKRFKKKKSQVQFLKSKILNKKNTKLVKLIFIFVEKNLV